MSVAAQISLLLALGEKLFDAIPLEKMREAELHLRKTVMELPASIREKMLLGESQAAMIHIKQALAAFSRP